MTARSQNVILPVDFLEVKSTANPIFLVLAMRMVPHAGENPNIYHEIRENHVFVVRKSPSISTIKSKDSLTTCFLVRCSDNQKQRASGK